MQFIKEWRGDGGGERVAERNVHESSRKRARDGDGDENGRHQSFGSETGIGSGTGCGAGIRSRIETDREDQEYEIRGSSTTIHKDSLPSSRFPDPSASSASSPVDVALALATLPPSIHPDRRANILNAADPATSPTPAPPRSGDTYFPSSNPPSRRKSKSMPPPPFATNATKTTRSETSTPKGTSPPIDNVTQPQAHLLESLNGFAQSIMSAASLAVRRELTKQQAVGQQKEHDRQAKFKSTFLTLIEDAESRAEGIEKLSMGIEKQIDLSSETQSTIVMALASQLQKSEFSDRAPSSVRRLEDDLADIKADVKAAKQDIYSTRDRDRDHGLFKKDLGDLKANLKGAGKRLDYLNREAVLTDGLQKKLSALVTKDELHRVTADEVRKHVTDALVPTEKKLASLTLEAANLNQRIKGVEDVTHEYRETSEGNDQQQCSRFGRLDTSLNDIQMALSRLELLVQEQKQDYAAVKVTLGAQDGALAELDTYVRRNPSEAPGLGTRVLRNSDQIQLLRQDCEELKEAVRQTRDLQAASNIDPLPQVSKASVNADSRIEEEVRLIRSDLDALKREQPDLNLNRENVVLIRTDLDSLINEEKLKDMGVAEGFEAIEESVKKQREDLARLQGEIRLVKQSQTPQTVHNHPPTPPTPRESDHQKLQDVESGLGKLTKTTQGLELFVNSQQQKFDGLTSDRVVQSMVHQMQQMYPQHPGNLTNLVNQLVARQARVDSYLGGNLKDRLVSIESQIAAAREVTDPRVEEASQFGAETRTILFATISSLKQDIKGLREAAQAALQSRPLDNSEYGNRIDELTDRVITLEARYIQAIGAFETNQTDLIGKVKHLQHRYGLGSARSTPGELTLTAASRSSKSVERNGGPLSSADSDDSDDSDTPLNQRVNGGGRRDPKPKPKPNLKRKAMDSDGRESDGNGEAGATNPKKVPRRRNVSGKKAFS